MISKQASNTKPFTVMDILEHAQELERQGHNVIHLEIGEPNFKTPKPIIDASINAIKAGKTTYTHSLGLIELREAITEHYYNKYKINISPDQVLVSSGTSPAMLILFQTILEKDDEFIISNPYYPCYPNFVIGVGAKAVLVDVLEDEGFQFNINNLKQNISPKTKGILINSPGNPTGAIYKKKRLEEISNINFPYIVSDEVYHGLSYDNNKEHTMLEFANNAIIINGFSKLYAMTGWRLGYVIVPKDLIRPLQRLQQNYFISANSFVQWAGIAALKETSNNISSMKKEYNERRIYMINRLRSMGFIIKHEPKGAFYVFVNARHINPDSKSLAFSILNKVYLGVAPGIDFGKNAEGYLRFSYAGSLENIKIGLNRLEKFIKKHTTN